MELKMRTHEEMKAYVEGYNACNKRFRECLKDRKSVVDAVKTMDVFIATVNGILKNPYRKETETWQSKALEQEPCEDCINRQAVLEGIAEWVADGYADSEADISHISSLVTHLPSVTPKGKTSWIPVSERLPEDFQRVLVTIVNYKGDKVVRVAEYYNYNNDRKGIFHINENHEQWEVGEKGLLAWMPLPEPYKADKEAEDEGSGV